MERERRLALRREREVHAVAELVGHRHHVAQPVGVVQHDERVRVLGDRRAERAAALALARLGVDALVREERLRHLLDVAREARERAPDDLARLLVRERAALAERRVLVGQVELRSSPSSSALRRYQRCAMSWRDSIAAIIASTASVSSSFARFRCAIGPVVGAQPVVHEAVGDERVVAMREHRRERLERPVQRVQRAQPQGPVGGVHVREQLVDRVVARAVAGVERDLDVRHRLLEQVLPRHRARPASAPPRPAPRAPDSLCGRYRRRLRRWWRSRGHLRGVGERLGDVVVERDPLQLEEPQRVRDLHVLLLDHGLEVARLVVVDVDGAAQADVRAGARDGVVDLRDLGQGGWRGRRRRARRSGRGSARRRRRRPRGCPPRGRGRRRRRRRSGTGPSARPARAVRWGRWRSRMKSTSPRVTNARGSARPTCRGQTLNAPRAGSDPGPDAHGPRARRTTPHRARAAGADRARSVTRRPVSAPGSGSPGRPAPARAPSRPGSARAGTAPPSRSRRPAPSRRPGSAP